MTAPQTPRGATSAADNEARLQLGLTLAVGAVAACASWSHVLDLATEHGQSGWLAWAVAACIETGAVSAGLEVRRRRRAGQPSGFPIGVLLGATVLQLAAQIAQAERTPWGVVLAAVPALTFLTLVKLTLARTFASVAGEGAALVQVSDAKPGLDTSAPAVTGPASRALVAGTTAPAGPESGEGAEGDDDRAKGDLLLIGRAVADELAREGQPLNRRNLLAGIRARGRSCSTERASALLRALRAA